MIDMPGRGVLEAPTIEKTRLWLSQKDTKVLSIELAYPNSCVN